MGIMSIKFRLLELGTGEYVYEMKRNWCTPWQECCSYDKSMEHVKVLMVNGINYEKRKILRRQKKIIEVVAKFYNLEEKNLFDQTRRKEIVRPRQVAMFLLRKELKYSHKLEIDSLA